jgi:hypothetical protein
LPSNSKLAKLAAGALLLEERKARAALAAAVGRHARDAADEIERQNRNHAKLAAVLLASKAMAIELTAALRTARADARAAARRRLAKELTAAGIIMSVRDGRTAEAQREDEVYAQSAADSLAGQWRSLAIVGVMSAERKDVSAAASVRKTSKPMQHRVVRTAATEVARAFSSEHASAIEEASLSYPDEHGLVRVWSAILDMRVCPSCAAMHGETAPIGGEFANGSAPGEIHVCCRCVEIVVPEAEALRAAA